MMADYRPSWMAAPKPVVAPLEDKIDRLADLIAMLAQAMPTEPAPVVVETDPAIIDLLQQVVNREPPAPQVVEFNQPATTPTVSVDLTELREELQRLGEQIKSASNRAGGQVAVGGASVTGTRNASNERINPLTEETFVAPSTPYIGSKSAATQTTVVTPASGSAVRLRRVWLQADSALDTGIVVVTVRVGSTVIDVVELTGSQPYVNPEIRVGAADEVVSIECSSSATVRYNLSVQEFTP